MKISFKGAPKKATRAEAPKRTVLIDTREQKPWRFANSRRATLSYGDYSLEGLTHWIRIERKSINDLVGSVSPKKKVGAGEEARSPRQRLRDEFAWLSESVALRYLIIEGSIDDVLGHDYAGMMHPHAVLGHVIRWEQRFNLHVVWAGSSSVASNYAARILSAAERLWEESCDADNAGTTSEGGHQESSNGTGGEDIR